MISIRRKYSSLTADRLWKVTTGAQRSTNRRFVEWAPLCSSRRMVRVHMNSHLSSLTLPGTYGSFLLQAVHAHFFPVCENLSSQQNGQVLVIALFIPSTSELCSREKLHHQYGIMVWTTSFTISFRHASAFSGSRLRVACEDSTASLSQHRPTHASDTPPNLISTLLEDNLGYLWIGRSCFSRIKKKNFITFLDAEQHSVSIKVLLRNRGSFKCHVAQLMEDSPWKHDIDLYRSPF